MTTRMTINGVSTCQTAGTESTRVSNQALADVNAHLCSTIIATIAMESYSHVSAPHWRSAEPNGMNG